MRQRYREDARAAMIAAVGVIFIALAAASCPHDRVAFTSISAAVDGAQTALKAWNEHFYAPGVKVDPALWNARRDKAEAAYVKFQTTARLATTLAQDVSQRDNATKIASDAAADLLALIASLEK